MIRRFFLSSPVLVVAAHLRNQTLELAAVPARVEERVERVHLIRHRLLVPFPGGHDLPDVAAFLNSQQLRFLNEEIQEDYLDPLLEQMKTELGLSDDEVVLMPALFEEPVGCLGLVAALIPGMANLFVSNRGDQTDVFLADPFMRESLSSAAGQDQDPFIADVTDRMPPHINFHFVDDWSMYHMALGEVHCGSNSTRTPAAHWWETAVHLLPEAP